MGKVTLSNYGGMGWPAYLWIAALTYLILGCILMMGIISVSNVSPCILAIMKHLLVLYRCYYMDNHSGVTTHLEPDILECEVKWALGSITMNKAGGGDGIPIQLFQILKDDAVKGLHSICQQIWKIQQWPQDWKRSVFIPIPKKGNAKECSNSCTIGLILHASKVMLKILQARL